MNKSLFEELEASFKGLDLKAAITDIGSEKSGTIMQDFMISALEFGLDNLPNDVRDKLLSKYITTDLAVNHIITNEVDVLDHNVPVDIVKAMGLAIPDITTAQLKINEFCVRYPEEAKVIYTELNYYIPQEDK